MDNTQSEEVNVAGSKTVFFDRKKLKTPDSENQQSIDSIKIFSHQNLSNDVHHVHLLPEIDLSLAVDAETENINAAINIIESVLPVWHDEPERMFEADCLEAIRTIRADAGLWAKYRVKMKQSKPSGVLLSDIDDATAPPNESSGSSNDSIAADLIGLVMGRGELFFDANADKAYFDGDINGARTTLALESKSFIEWLSFAYYTATKNESGGAVGMSASEASIKQARFALCGIAKHDGSKRRVYLRVASVSDGRHFIFVADDRLRAVEVSETGWRLIDSYPVKFMKTANMKSLPLPASTGDYNLLWNYVNVNENDRILVLAWMLECYRSETPNPVLQLSGGQGCAKSSSQNRLRELIDNNAVNLRSSPKAAEDVFISSGHNWLVSFENMSNLTPHMQDALCVLATGGGFATRTFYSNTDETVINTKRPVIINGISHVITAQDLTDRSIQIELQRIDYIEESVIAENWAIDAPIIFGGILDLFAKTLAQLPHVKLNKPPRMADFTRLGEAMALAMGHTAGHFTQIYTNNRNESIGKAIEASPAAAAIRELVADYNGFSGIAFTGTMQALLNTLEKYKTDSSSWPKSARGLGDVLRRQQSALNSVGISVEISKPKKDGVHITIKKVCEFGERRLRDFGGGEKKSD